MANVGGGTWFCILIYLSTYAVECIFLVVPEDVPMGFAAIYGFAPPIRKGNDHRFGFGFRLGNHADFQVLYEVGPQLYTAPMKPPRVRSASFRQISRRRPVLEALFRLGIFKEASYVTNIIETDDDCPYEPR